MLLLDYLIADTVAIGSRANVQFRFTHRSNIINLNSNIKTSSVGIIFTMHVHLHVIGSFRLRRDQVDNIRNLLTQSNLDSWKLQNEYSPFRC